MYIYDPFVPDGGCEGGNGGTASGMACNSVYLVIEVFDDVTGTWSVWWSGYGWECS